VEKNASIGARCANGARNATNMNLLASVNISLPTSSPTVSNENTPTTDSKSRPLVAVGRDIEENIGSISFRTDTNTLETGFHS
jgi:hypothetical protein